MVWVGELVKDFLERLALVLAETTREKRGQVLGKTCREKQGRGRPKGPGTVGQTVEKLTCQGQWELEELLARRGASVAFHVGVQAGWF